MKDRQHDNPTGFQQIGDEVRESMHANPTNATVDDATPIGILENAVQCLADFVANSFPSPRRLASYQSTSASNSLRAGRRKTSGRLTGPFVY